jgi:hypothetical protein
MDTSDKKIMDKWILNDIHLCFEYINGQTENAYIQGCFGSGVHVNPNHQAIRCYSERKIIFFNKLTSIHEL